MTDQPSAPRTRTDQRWVGVDPSEDDNRPPPLTRARTVRAALRLVDEQGLTALTMRALATELKVSPMALYNHVRDKEELLDLMLDLMLGEVDCSAVEGDWVTQLRALASNFHQALSAHRNLVQVYSSRVKIGPNGLRVIERAIGLLLQAGFPPHEAAPACLTIFTYIVGRHQMGGIMPFSGAAAQKDTDYYLALSPEQIPGILTVAAHLGGVHKPGLFEYGLETLLCGLKTKLAAVNRAEPRVKQD